MSVVPDGITLLPASAGTGKTFRIVDVLRALVLDEGLDLRRIVVVTFTEAAARELRERIRARFVAAREGLTHRAAGLAWQATDSALDTWVEAQVRAGSATEKADRAWSTLVAFDETCIGTIHSFCSRVLTEAAFEAGSVFHTEMLHDERTVIGEVVRDFWTRHTYDVPRATLASLKALGIDPDGMAHLASCASDPSLLVVPPDPGRIDPVDLAHWARCVGDVRRLWTADAAEIRQRVLTDTHLCRRKTREQLVSLPPGLARRLLNEIGPWLEGGQVPGHALPGWVERLSTSALREATFPGEPPPEHRFFDAVQALRDEHSRLAPALGAWRLSLQHEVVRDVRTRLAEALRRRNALTFDTLLEEVRRPVASADRGPRVREAVRRRYDLAVIDEFQDTDPCQWDIFRLLFGDRLLLVGDPKQAVYSFRGADFGTYQRAATSCSVPETLDRNYRTDQGLVEAIHHLFARPAVAHPMLDPDIPFPEVHAAHTVARLDGGRPPLHIRLLPREGRRLWQGRFLTKPDMERHLPAMVANDVVRELQRGGRVGDTPVGPGHCAVLTRTNDQARDVAHELLRRGIPATVRSDDSVMKTPEREALVHVLRAVHDPLRTKLVRRALLTDLLGYGAADLVALQSDDARWIEVAGRFRRWRALWEDGGVLSVIRGLLHEGGVARRLLLQGRERALTNVRHLGELLQRVARERRLPPSGLLSWLEAGGPGLDDDDTALRIETDAEAVQVVTVHSAKGLQYPLVWLPFLQGGTYVSQKDKEHLVIHDPDDPAVRRLDLGSPQKPMLLARKDHEARAEELRLGYVALTRAEHRCVLYWGAGGPRSALAWVIHQRQWMRPLDQERTRQIENRFYWDAELGDAKLREDLESLSGHPHIAWDEADWGDADVVERWVPDGSIDAPLAAAAMSRSVPLDRTWRRESFTGMTRAVATYDPRPHVDHDDEVEPATEDLATPEPVPLAHIPGGARFGTFLHDVLEHADLAAGAAGLRPLVARGLVRHNLDPTWEDALVDALAQALEAPILPDGLTVAGITGRWNELEFHLPLAGGFAPGPRAVTSEGVAQAFAATLGPGLPPDWRAHLERLRFQPARGFLTGSIDMVFGHAGRWYLADWKSNRLGPGWQDYAPDALPHRMVQAMYPLQYHLYTVALVRVLGARLPAFDYERDFGGSLYLFLRGMSPDRPGHGVFFDRPPAELVSRLDRLFTEGA